ncbi:MAG: kynurenine formamidase [Planctomycetes bacterium]|nr:kynurenine formamidase [Planctomycetota bacterium]
MQPNAATDIIDISPLFSPRLAVFPGDEPIVREVKLDMKRGDNITLSALRATVHLGSHADAPSHYGRDGRAIDEQPLDLYWGPCEVVQVRAGVRPPSGRVARADLDVGPGWQPRFERLLIATRSYSNPEQWDGSFLGLEPTLVDVLADRGVRLIGIDTPSVDTADSKDLPTHARFLARGVAIIEGLVLRTVTPGDFEFCGLPLRLEGFDGSPIRAALRPMRPMHEMHQMPARSTPP